MPVALQFVPVVEGDVLQVGNVCDVVQGEVGLDLQVLGAGDVGGALLVAGALQPPEGAVQAADELGPLCLYTSASTMGRRQPLLW